MKIKRYRKNNPFIDVLKNESGFALATVIILLIVLATLIFTSTQWSATDIKRTADYTKTRDSFYTAEAGLQRAFNYMNYDDSTGVCPGAAGDGFDDELQHGTTFGGDWPGNLFDDVDFNGGNYTVTAVDNNDDGDQSTDLDHTIILTSTGIKRNVSATVQAVAFRPLFEADGALITNGDLTGNGSFTITGTAGTAHSNSNFDQSGISGSSVYTSATGTCTGTTCSNTGGGSYQKEKPLPVVSDAEIQAFKNKSNVVLKSDGNIDIHDLSLPSSDPNFTLTITQEDFGGITCWRNDGAAIGTGCTNPGDDWYDLTQQYGDLDRTNGANAKWKLANNRAPDGVMIYVEGDIQITGSPSPWEVSIISEGYIDLGGNTTITNYRDPNLDTATQDMFFLAGTDFEMGGNVTVGTSTTLEQGSVIARDQMSVAGDVYLRGWIIATDLTTSESLVTSNVISGSLVIEYDGDLQAPFLGCKLNILSWKEIGSGIS